ncbi:DMT family transporter [Candidatus Synechococcus calcipolaris G9]|uniref:DMT family transporter n=1 Tax=Candidatus Synechococcus calcipolaris G9 TaxID=1497997 RepID=A0ABT6F1V3_9SYNE|nr:DMT family transporter [Candidatus Synechococcus calcipolaris]MDG2991836.1 DMT family transporter [Candidatus Synechococcus calcipolaris G9]
MRYPRLLAAIPGRVYLLVAVILFAASNSVVRLLTDLGQAHLMDGRNPITFCNVLFVGNLCALLALIALYYPQLQWTQIKPLTKKDWLGLLGVSILAGAIAPALFFKALELTDVNNVVLISRVEPPLGLALAVWFLGSPINRWVGVGAAISFLGVFLAIVWPSAQGDGMPWLEMTIGRGELLAVLGAVAAAIATIISKLSLNAISFGIFNVLRTAIATILFFVVGTVLFGIEHFMDAFSPFVWQWMMIYGLVIVVAGQLSWFEGLKRTTASDVSLISSFSPIAGVFAAYLLLGEVPTLAQYIGGGVIILGMMINQVGVVKLSESRQVAPSLAFQKRLDADAGTGFKGL